MDSFRCRRRLSPARTATGDRPRSICCPSSSISGDSLRRATEAARANLLNADWNRKDRNHHGGQPGRGRLLSVAELDSELEISQSTLETRRESLELTQDRAERTASPRCSIVRQAEQLVDSAAESIPQLQQQIEQTENQISLLLGKNPGGIEREQPFNGEHVPPEVPAGLPSALLERRPDIRAAEQALIAANANIGVAKAAYFPQISLTGSSAARARSWPTCSPARTRAWSFVPQMTQPIFTAGRLRTMCGWPRRSARMRRSRTKNRSSTAFSEVSDALIAHQRDARKPGRAAEAGDRAAGPQAPGLPYAIAAAWTRNSMRSMRTAICFRPS